jgi:hypothetical protein
MSTRAGFAGALVLGSGLLFGCEKTPAAQSPASQAAAQRARCTADFSDAAIGRVLDGSAVERVEPFYTGYTSKSSNPRLQGAAIVVRPARGETAEWLDRALECHEAQQLTTQASGSSARTDPFWLPGSRVQIDVTSARDGFRIQLSGGSSAEARAILARAQALPSGAAAPENPTAVFDAR